MPLEPIRGRVAWIFSEANFDVDQIVGVKNIKITNVAELAGLAMTSYDPEFAASVRPGDVVVGAGNFGYGHPHYPPLRALRHLGVAAAGMIAEPHDQAARALQADGLDQFIAQLREQAAMGQQHALFMEPDLARLGIDRDEAPVLWQAAL